MSPTLRPGLHPGAPLKQSCSGAIEKDQRSIFINTEDLPLSPPPVHQVQQRQGSLRSHSYPSHSRVPFFSAAQRTAAEALRFLLPAASHSPCSIYQPPPSFWAASSAVSLQPGVLAKTLMSLRSLRVTWNWGKGAGTKEMNSWIPKSVDTHRASVKQCGFNGAG